MESSTLPRLDAEWFENDPNCNTWSSDDDLENFSQVSKPSWSTENNLTQKQVTTASDLLISASDKAGMQGIDRERINAILLRESGNSTFMQRQRRMDENTNQKIAEMKQRLEEKDNESSTNDCWREKLRQSTDLLLERYQKQRQPLSAYVVIDMDGFFISCHILDHPHLANIPACVGGTSMISTSNYEARKYGVRAAMPGYLGSALVNELSQGKETLTFVKSDFNLYKRKSAEIKTILEEYDPDLKMYSLDEAYMNIGPYVHTLLNKNGDISHEGIRKILLDKNKGTPQKEHNISLQEAETTLFHATAQKLLSSIREKVKNITGLTCSAGLASNFLLSKVASDVNKPNGQHFVGPTEDQIRAFINPLPIRKINGIGRVMEKTLKGVLGIETVEDLYNHRAEVYFLFKPATAHFLLQASIGYSGLQAVGDETIDNDSDEAIQRKGISNERTFSPTSTWTELCSRLETIALSLVQDLKERNLKPKTVTLKVKMANFDILTKAHTREVAFFQPFNYSHSSQDMIDVVINLLKEARRAHYRTYKNKESSSSRFLNDTFAVRLLGVRCSNFQLERDNQTSLALFCGSISPDRTTKSPRSKNLKNIGFTERGMIQSSDVIVRINPYQLKAHNVTQCTTHNSNSSKSSLGPLNPTEIVSVSSENSSTIQCPICKMTFPSDKLDNALLNSHVDSCLNVPTVKLLAKEETFCARLKEVKSKKKCVLTDFFH